MKQFIILFVVVLGSALAQPPPPECMAGPPKGKHPRDCCKIPDLMPKAMIDKCIAAHPMPSPPPPGLPKGCCISECVLNETKILIDGKLDKAAAVKYISEQLKGEEEAIKVAVAAIDHCEKEVAGKKAGFEAMVKAAAPGEKVCNMVSGFMIGCINGQVFKNCPKDKYTADASCDAIKAFADKCGCLSPLMVKA